MRTTVCLALLSLVGLVPALDAQEVAHAEQHFGVHRAGAKRYASLDLATGALSSSKSAGVPCWSNTDTSGFFAISGSSGGIDEWIATGNSLTSDEASGCPDGTDIVRAFTFGYATNALDSSVSGPGAAMTLAFYHDPDAVGGLTSPQVCGGPQGVDQLGAGHLAAAFTFSGLPGASVPGTSVPSWVISLDLVASGQEFVLRDDGDIPGAFAFSWVFDQFGTGPLLCCVGNGSGGPDGNGMFDAFDWYSPPAYSGGSLLGCFFSPGTFSFASWHLTLEEEDGSCGTASIDAIRTGVGNANGSYSVTTPATIRGTWSARVDNAGKPQASLALVLGYSAPLDLATGFGTLLVDVSDPGGELIGLGLSLFGSGGPGVAAFSRAVPLDLDLCGWKVFSQAVRLGGGIDLTNAVDFTVGF